jgi:hypothetical protein
MAIFTPPSMRRRPPAWVEEPHSEPSTIGRAIEDIERAAKASCGPIDLRSELAGFRVEDARRALAGLPAPGDYKVLVKPLRYRKRPHLSALCEFDVRRIVLRVPEPFRSFDELVYHSARRKPEPGMPLHLTDALNCHQRKNLLEPQRVAGVALTMRARAGGHCGKAGRGVGVDERWITIQGSRVVRLLAN